MDAYRKSPTATLNRRRVERGTELTIRDLRGRVRFLALVTHVETGDQWIDAVDARGSLRSFRLTAVERVHRTERMR